MLPLLALSSNLSPNPHPDPHILLLPLTFINQVKLILLAPGVAETWYVGVLPQVGKNGTEYTIWFSSPCAPLCSEHGKCTESGPMTGVCVCNEQYAGVACQTRFVFYRYQLF